MEYCDYFHAEARARGEDVLRINMDETSVALIQKPLRGVLMRVGGRRRGTALRDGVPPDPCSGRTSHTQLSSPTTLL